MRRVAVPLLAALVLTALGTTGCGEVATGQDVGAPGGGPTTSPDPDQVVSSPPTPGLSPDPGGSTPSGPPVPATLTVQLDDGTGTLTDFTLTCDPTGAGTTDGPGVDAAAACAAVAAAGGAAAFAPADPARVCTDIYGGPQTAVVEGTVDGRPVSATFRRVDGCEVSRWDALLGLLPSAGL